MYIMIKDNIRIRIRMLLQKSLKPMTSNSSICVSLPLSTLLPCFCNTYLSILPPPKEYFFSMLLLLPWLICFVVYVILYAPLVPHLP